MDGKIWTETIKQGTLAVDTFLLLRLVSLSMLGHLNGPGCDAWSFGMVLGAMLGHLDGPGCDFVLLLVTVKCKMSTFNFNNGIKLKL